MDQNGSNSCFDTAPSLAYDSAICSCICIRLSVSLYYFPIQYIRNDVYLFKHCLAVEKHILFKSRFRSRFEITVCKCCWVACVERRSQGRLWHEHSSCLAERIHGQGSGRIHPGRWHSDKPPRPGVELCKYEFAWLVKVGFRLINFIVVNKNIWDISWTTHIPSSTSRPKVYKFQLVNLLYKPIFRETVTKST